MQSILISGQTHAGLRRSANQDASITRCLRADDKMLAAVIDGVGGYAGGERAAAIAKDCIEQYMQTPSGHTLAMLREAVVFANNEIATQRKTDQRLREMCCVLTALVADTLAKQIFFVHIGDTRLYRYRGGLLQKLTRDHSFVGIREDAGELSEQEAMAHPHRNQILREVGSALHRLDDDDFMDFGRETFFPGDLLLLCSDGLTDMVRSEQVSAVLAGTGKLEDKTNSLIDLANKAGGFDNITVVLLQYPGIPAEEPAGAMLTSDTKETKAASVQSRQRKKQWGKSTLIAALMFLFMTAAAGWYLITPKKLSVPAATRSFPILHTDSISNDSNHLQTAGRSNHPAMEGPVKKLADTLHISTTQSLVDLQKFTDSTGRPLVLVPARNFPRQFAALSITVKSAKPGDTIAIGNLHFNGFETGIDIPFPVSIKTQGLVFENTIHPFRYLFRPGSKQRSTLFMNTVKQ